MNLFLTPCSNLELSIIKIIWICFSFWVSRSVILVKNQHVLAFHSWHDLMQKKKKVSIQDREWIGTKLAMHTMSMFQNVHMKSYSCFLIPGIKLKFNIGLESSGKWNNVKIIKEHEN